MSLEKTMSIDKIEILESGHIQVRRATKIMEDGEEISKAYYRYVLNPGDSLEGQEKKVIAIAKAIWTDEVVASHKAMIESQVTGL